MVFLRTLTTFEEKGQQIGPLAGGNGVLGNDTDNVGTGFPNRGTAQHTIQ